MSFNLKKQPVKSKIGQQLSITEVAELMGLTESTVRNWIADGKLRAYRYGPRLIRIDEKDLLGMREQIAPTTFEHVNGSGGR